MPASDTAAIRISGAREHNLRDVSLDLPKGRLICFTGVSGSGKSSLAFDTLYAEGQRRYIESLSSYARQFMGQLPKPNVDQITGLSPSVSIQQKTSGWNPRSTVGTITQVYDYLRVLFARAGVPHCTQCGKPIAAQTREQMTARILALPEGTPFLLLARKIRGQKGEYKDLFHELLQQGFARARVDGAVVELAEPPPLDRYRKHDIEVVIDRLIVRPSARTRIAEALDLALTAGEGTAVVAVLASTAGTPEGSAAADEADAPLAPPPARGRARRAARKSASSATRAPGAPEDILLSAGFACSGCGLSFEPPSPQMFSFNSPQGMCPHCDGLGTRYDFDPELLVPDSSRSFVDPCVVALRKRPGRWRMHVYEGVARRLGIDLETPWRELPPAARRALLYGMGDERITYEWRTDRGSWKHGDKFDGVIAELTAKYKQSTSAIVRRFYEQFMRETPCPRCAGARLCEAALAVKLPVRAADGGALTWLNMHELSRLSIRDALSALQNMALDGVRALIAEEPLKEANARLRFLLDVGLDYLSLERAAPTLSGGESQRIRLASQIGSGLVGVLYVLDEPSIGLHPRDNGRLLRSLQKLRDMGNTVVVVEHDRETMEAADHIVDFGPGPGVRGGHVVAQGALADVASAPESLTGAYLAGRAEIPVPEQRRPVGQRRA